MMTTAPIARAATGHDFVSRVNEAPPGTPLAEPGVATVERSTGRIFMADSGSGAVDVFGASGSFVTQLGEGLEPSGVAVDEASGDVFVSSGSSLLVFKARTGGGFELLSEWSGASTPAAATGS